MLEFLSRNAKFIIAAIMLSVCTYLGYQNGYDKADLKWKETIQNEYITKQEANRQTQLALNDISKGYQEDLANSEANATRTVDALNKSGVRLRVKLNATSAQLRECGLQSDGKAELHRETSEALIRITQDADNHVKALQNTVRALQGGDNGLQR